MRLTANVSDDVQVRNVEFYVDGFKVATDGNFSFEHRFIAPSGITSITVRARASDTGGNMTWSDLLELTITPDTTAPTLLRHTPATGAFTGVANTISMFFNEPIAEASLNHSTLELRHAGANGILGDGDDILFSGGRFSYHPELSLAAYTLDAILPQGSYRVTLANTITRCGR